MEEDDPLRKDLERASEVEAAIEVLLQSADQGSWWDLLRSPGDFGDVLQVAASRGKTDVLEVLLAAGAPIEADGRSALVSAMSSKRGDSAELLLSLGGDRYFCERQGGYTPMWEACARGRDGLLCLLMAGNSPDEMVTAPPGSPWTGRIPALLVACSWGNVATVEALLQAGVSSESTAQVLWMCVTDPGVVSLLIRVAPMGAELKAVLPKSRVQHCKTIAGAVHILNDPRSLVEPSGSHEDHWNNFLLLSYRRHCRGLIELALMCGGDTRTEEPRYGLCPLHLARDAQMVELLVCSGANVDATASRRSLKDSVLSWACRMSTCAVVEVLLSCGATPTEHTFTWIPSRRECCDLICSLLSFATASQMEYLATRLNFPPQNTEALDLLLCSRFQSVLPVQLPDFPPPDTDTIPSECPRKRPRRGTS